MVDGKTLYHNAIARIRQLEELNKVLAAEVDRMRPVVDAAIKWNETNYRDMKECELALDAIGNACDDLRIE